MPTGTHSRVSGGVCREASMATSATTTRGARLPARSAAIATFSSAVVITGTSVTWATSVPVGPAVAPAEGPDACWRPVPTMPPSATTRAARIAAGISHRCGRSSRLWATMVSAAISRSVARSESGAAGRGADLSASRTRRSRSSLTTASQRPQPTRRRCCRPALPGHDAGGTSRCRAASPCARRPPPG